MKINTRIFITDQFLWDVVYKFFTTVDDVVDFLLSNKYKQISILIGDDNPIIKKYRKDKNRQQFSQLIYYLKKKNYIKVKSLRSKKAIILTKEGLSRTLRASFKTQEKKKRKDGKWIMIIFDIPQKHNKARSLLRSILQNLGYKMFQHSVWITPYDVGENTEKLLQAYNLESYVKIFLIEEL